MEPELPLTLQNFFSQILRCSPFIKPCLPFRYLHENKNKKQKRVLGECWLDSSIYIKHIKSMENMAMLMMLRLLWNLTLNNNNSLLLNSDLMWYRIPSNFTEWGLDWVKITFIICQVHCFGITGQLILLWSDPALNAGPCRNSKPHPIATQNNIRSGFAQDSALSHHVPHYDLWWEQNTSFMAQPYITKSCAAKVESDTPLQMSHWHFYLLSN